MKLSRYNILKIFDNRYFIINTLNSSFLELSWEEYYLISCNSIQNLDVTLLEHLTESGMIIKSDINELKLLKNRYLEEQQAKDLLTITIAPTLKCNFACPYCYENRNGKVINSEEQFQIINFIESQLKLGYKKINVIWFGGEPLLVFNIIENMSAKLIELCNKYCVNYEALLTTNGYLLDKNIVDKLENLKINQLYITLDGLSNVHDKRRFLINGNPTFKTIIQNIKNAKEKNTNIIIRMNVDKTNENEIDNLRNYVANSLKIPMYLGLVRQYTDSCKKEENNYFSKEEYAHIQDLFYSKQNIDNDVEYKFPRQLPIYCRACKVGTFVIDPDLNIFKCENDIGRVEKRISNINNYPFADELNGICNKSYYEWDPFVYQQCLDCNIMPICMGGCPFISIKTSQPECEIYKYNFDNVVKKLVLKHDS